MTSRCFSGICRPSASAARSSLRTAAADTSDANERSETLPALRLPPSQKFLKQRGVRLPLRGPFYRASRSRHRSAGRHSLTASALFGSSRRAALIVQPGLRGVKPGPPRQCGAEVDLAPFHVARRLLEFCDFRKERLYKLLHTPIAISVGLGPIIGDENRTDRDRIHALTASNEVGIIVMIERRWKIIANKLGGIWDRHEM